MQKRVEQLLEAAAGKRGIVYIEFPYRPLRNLQYWIADVAYIPKADWDALPHNEYPVYAPPLIVEVLSPSNTAVKLNRQMIVALSAGTQEFWVVDPAEQSIRVTALGATTVCGANEVIQSAVIGGSIPVRDMFAL